MPKKVYIIRCSYFEIYNDAVYDLLSDHTEASFHEPLQLLEDIKVRYSRINIPFIRRRSSLWRG